MSPVMSDLSPGLSVSPVMSDLSPGLYGGAEVSPGAEPLHHRRGGHFCGGHTGQSSGVKLWVEFRGQAVGNHSDCYSKQDQILN